MPFFRPMRESVVALWRRTERQFPEAPRPFVRLLKALLVVSVLGWAASFALDESGASQSDEAWSTSQVLNAARSRLAAYTGVLDTVRDRLAADAPIRYFTHQRMLADLFSGLRLRDSIYAAQFPDSALTVQTPNGRRTADHGCAVYTADGRLLAWYSSPSVTFGFDTVLSGEMLLANRDKGVFLENEPVYAYLTSIRKLVSKEGVLEGYVETKRLLATKELLGQRSEGYFIATLSDPAQRNVTINFGGVPGRLQSDRNWVRTDLFAEPNDPASYVGSLAIATRPNSEPSLLYRVIDGLWRLTATLFLFAALVWLFFAIAEPVDNARPLITRIWFSVIVLGAAALVRFGVVWIGGLSLLIGDSFQNAADFSTSWGYGIARDPFHLFITSVFATACAVMLWIVWMPRQRLVRDDSKKKDIEQIVRREAWMLILFMIAVVFGLQLLADGMSATVESIITNGSLRYTTVRQVLPPPGLLMMLVAFLGFGVAYLFVVSLLLTFGLRAAIFLISRRLSLLTRIIGGSVILAALMAAAVIISDNWHLSDVTLLYRSAVAALAFAVSLSVIAIDALSPDPVEGGPSFLYKLPRSSRSILFILTISALIMSPLVASKQLAADKAAAVRLVKQNALVSATELSKSVSQMLADARERLQGWSQAARDSTSLREFAFLTWLDEAREHPTWEASITLDREQQPSLLSHFATPGSALELRRIAPIIDSVQKIARDSTRASVIAVVPAVTSASTPVAIGIIRIADTMHIANAARMGTLRAVVALWTDLPVPTRPLMRASIGGTAGTALGGTTYAATAVSDGSFVVSEYRPNTRRITNTPWLDIPATLPAWTLRLKSNQSTWQPSYIGSQRYQTLYYRLPSSETVLTISIPEPTYSTTLEFALRLNAIGLIYGSVIVLVLLLARQVAVGRVRFTLRFRDRIFLIVLLISLVPLVVVTNVTRSLLSERAQSEEQDRLARDATVIRDRITRLFEVPADTTRKVESVHALQDEVESLSQIIGREFSVFDASGRLRASSRPELYESSLFANTVSSRALEEVSFGKRTFYTQPVRMDGETFAASYQPVTTPSGSRLLAIISLITINEASQIDAEVARTTTFIYGIFAALGLVLLGIGALFAARVASPILQLIHATERVAKGALKTSIPVTRDDEIGELMQSFNQMTSELEKSREIVAQTERELAWKEMARQVAHEIKNPLTPMKLSVQHLEHAHEAKDPNFNTIFRRVIRTLREQIDVLTRIATEFSRFGAMPRRKWGPVSLRQVCDSAVALFDADRNRIRFIIDVPKDLPLLHSDEDELRRAFVNLLRNAVQAIEGWGVIVIHADESQGMIHVRVRDTGYGMSDETLKRAFDPNFSTKTSGMGLGLALVKKTITDMAGQIRVESEPGHGTTFFIDLPARGYVEDEE
jgi:signal transduction histidine kinase